MQKGTVSLGIYWIFPMHSSCPTRHGISLENQEWLLIDMYYSDYIGYDYIGKLLAIQS